MNAEATGRSAAAPIQRDSIARALRSSRLVIMRLSFVMAKSASKRKLSLAVACPELTFAVAIWRSVAISFAMAW